MFFLGWYLDPEKEFPDPILLPGMIQVDKSLPFCSLDRISKSYITVLRNLEINDNQVTAGQTLCTIKLTADYKLSSNLTSQFFYDHNFSKFAISTAFPQTSIRSGISIRYIFGN